MLLTANNHSLDRYAIGVERTIDAIEAAGLKFTGTRRRGETERPWYTVTETVKDGETRRIAWLGCTYGTNGLPDRHGQVLLLLQGQGPGARTSSKRSPGATISTL